MRIRKFERQSVELVPPKALTLIQGLLQVFLLFRPKEKNELKIGEQLALKIKFVEVVCYFE